ncbi:MAG: hypothetical protein ABIH11_07255 [Candidatus Altiarchaeota archaeon]
MDENQLYLNSLYGILLVCVIVVSLNSFFRVFDHDEFEHVHSAWYVLNGYIPYRDFFQHHNPLLWYLLAPVILLFGETTTTLFACRLLMLAVAYGIIYLTYLVSRRLSDSTETRMLSIILMSSCLIFIDKVVEVRPAGIQTLLGMASLYYLLSHDGSSRRLALSALYLSIAVLFSQKALFLAAGIYAVLLHHVLSRERRVPALRDVGLYSLFFITPFILFLLLLYASGSLQDYYVTNWLVNVYLMQSFPITQQIYSLWINVFLWAIGLFAIPYLLKNSPRNGVKTISFLSLLLAASLFTVKLPHRQYFLPLIPLISILASILLTERLFPRIRPAYRFIAVLAMVSVPLLYSLATVQTLYPDYRQQLGVVELVPFKTSAGDYVYDGDINFNLYRRDLHYFWYSLHHGKGLDTYNMVTGGRYDDYDTCSLIKKKKPGIISDTLIDLRACGLSKDYRRTRFPGVYERKK